METLFTLTLDDVLHKIATESYLKPEFKITNSYDHNSIMRLEKLQNLRNFFIQEYSLAIPTRPIIDLIYDATIGKKIVEINAHKGLWSRLLKMRGCNIIPTDYFESYGYIQDQTFMPIENITAVDAVQIHRDCDVLMTIWPSADNDDVVNALKEFRGSTVIYIGVCNGARYANDNFLEELNKNWNEYYLQTKNFVLSWYGLYDGLSIYKRK
jgi:hypothetical protein